MFAASTVSNAGSVAACRREAGRAQGARHQAARAARRPGPRAGIGLRFEHGREFLETRPRVGFIEVHAENLFGAGGWPLELVERARRDHPLSLHGVGLSLGSTDPLSQTHIARLAGLIDRLEPALVSEHLCWTSHGGVHSNDLLPLPWTEEALDHVVRRLDAVQQALGHAILLENVSSYFEYADSSMPEWTFLAEVARRSGCGLLLDINNVFVSAHNHGFEANTYLRAIPQAAVREIHLAGHVRRAVPGGELLVDTHSEPVADAVWSLYAAALRRCGPVPTLIEWDHDLPPLSTLVAEAIKADAVMAACFARQAEPCDADA